jgi:CheY-like chemotaxis protein
LRGALILVVDDDALVREAMETLFQQWGCEVASAANGDQAVAQARRLVRVPDAIVCDYRLPEDETGIDAIRRLQAAVGADVPAALVTGDTAPERLREAQAGGYALLHKPLQPAKLRALLEHLLAARETRRAGTA